MKRGCDRNAVGFAVVIMPDIMQIASFAPSEDAFLPIYAKVESLSQYGIPVVNPHPALQATGVPPELLRVTDDDWHLGAFAIDQLAAYVADSSVLKDLVRQALDAKATAQGGDTSPPDAHRARDPDGETGPLSRR
jgi:hypothetical protein